MPKSPDCHPSSLRPAAQTVLKKSNCLNFQVEHDVRHHPVQNSKPCRKLRLVMLDWLGAPTWHFARSILNAGAGHSNSRSGGSISRSTESGWIGARPRLEGGAGRLARRPRAARRTQRARVDGLGRVGGLGRKTRRLGDQSGWTRRRRMGKAGRCGRRAARVNWRLQCKSESATRPVQR